MDTRKRNHVPMNVSRMETTGGMMRALLTNGEQMWETVQWQGDYGRDKCQVFQLIRVFGTHRRFITSSMAVGSPHGA